MKRILIDDLRDIVAEVVCRNAAQAIAALEREEFDVYYFDHDLGEKTTGYDILTWALENGHIHGDVYLITSNPVGRDRMSAALEASGFRRRGQHFSR